VLATEGYAGFTTRAVANAADITPGNLTYHYKTQRSLVRAVITGLIDDYAHQMEGEIKNSLSEPREGFAKIVAFLINDSTTPHTSRLFRELWAMALHDPFVAQAIDGLYDVMLPKLANLLRICRPGLSEKRSVEIILLLHMICEGANPIFGTTQRKGASVAQVTKLAVTALLNAAAHEDSQA
jgi:AcrR family transcriptional regulator